MFERVRSFLLYDIWRFDIKRMPWLKRLALWIIRVLSLSIRGFLNNRCSLRASSLTFFSLLSIVPIAAVVFGISQGFGLDKRLEALLFEQLSGQEAVARRILEFSKAMLANTRGGLIAGVGVLLLLWSVLKLLGNIEEAFNDIWQVPRGRTLVRKFADYIAIIFVCPILLLIASSATVLISSSVQGLVEQVDILARIGPVIFKVLGLLPFVMVWIPFTFIYLIMPNTKVHLFAAVAGGIVAGSAYQLLQALLVNAQIGVSQYNAIYGSFAALPLFLLWLELSWMIVLYGAEISYACQNVFKLEFAPDCREASFRLRGLVALRLVHYLIERFSKDAAPAPSAEEIAEAIGAPLCMVSELLAKLVEAAVVSRVENGFKIGYQPARDSERLSVYSVIDALLGPGEGGPLCLDSEEYRKLLSVIEKLGLELRDSTANVLLKNL